jgi:hypothetical protein
MLVTRVSAPGLFSSSTEIVCTLIDPAPGAGKAGACAP